MCAFDKGWETFAIIPNLVGKGQKKPKKPGKKGWGERPHPPLNNKWWKTKQHGKGKGVGRGTLLGWVRTYNGTMVLKKNPNSFRLLPTMANIFSLRLNCILGVQI